MTKSFTVFRDVEEEVKDFSKRLAKKLLIVKGHVPRQYGFSRQRKKIFMNKLESLKAWSCK